jgi:hypothetical protein
MLRLKERTIMLDNTMRILEGGLPGGELDVVHSLKYHS